MTPSSTSAAPGMAVPRSMELLESLATRPTPRMLTIVETQ